MISGNNKWRIQAMETTPAHSGNQSHTLPAMFQYQQTYSGPNTLSPLYSQLVPSLRKGTKTTMHFRQFCPDGLDKRLEKTHSKLGQLDKIKTQVNTITTRSDSMDKKMRNIETSQTFISKQFDS